MSNDIGGERWKQVVDAFKRKFKRHPNKKERLKLAEVFGFDLHLVKTQGKATDYQAKGATSESVRASMAVKSYNGKRRVRDDAIKAPRPVSPKACGSGKKYGTALRVLKPE